MEIILAKTAGFCFGVRRAVKTAENAAMLPGKCMTLGPIIHNRSVTEKLHGMGVSEISSVAEAHEGDTVIIRSHGVGPEYYRQLEERKANIIDATCPDVKKIHNIAKRETDEGRTVIVFGDRSHPEVQTIAGYCSDPVIVGNPEELRIWLKTGNNSEKPISLVSQTTGIRNIFESCVKKLKKECTNYKIFDTICNATSKRQEEAVTIAAQCDIMIVIGGKHSANSRHLCDVCESVCPRVLFVETADELADVDLTGVYKLGITAGASTPEWIIKEVYQKMSEKKTVKAVGAAEIEEEVTAGAMADESFAEMLEKSIKTLYNGDKVVGVVAAISGTEISVDLGTKHSGYIPLEELTDNPEAKAEDLVKVGDEIECYVLRVNDVEGTVALSKKRLDSVKAWDEISESQETKTIVEGYVTEENKGGIVVSCRGVRVFVPASQTGLPKDTPMNTLMKKKVKLRITEVNKARRRVVGSIRSVQAEERKAKADAIWASIEVGKQYDGIVKSLTSYGAFVDIGGIDGMVHVSELSWSRVRQPSDVLKVGDPIDVYVISFDKEKRKISLGHKKAEDNPWVKFTTNYAVGSVANVKIVKLMPFGAFAEIIEGVDGLIHISQIADRRIGKPGDVLTEGQMVDAKITEIDDEKKKVSLSIRALLEPQSEPVAEEVAE
ncbi:MAG: bifunctional 4-hydroxy-3-methylbut-2-enyl diphosphate reductase/30S ribosomal protein S1 [Ruminococcaceae bacterium]|nr:bifunctional 4-hydroxy-3-methylbut-2-enyl diphosphate reductase/30S ribosomal protein S1 [Oscillospiraceae bacterium]